jgi:HNH endonuclease
MSEQESRGSSPESASSWPGGPLEPAGRSEPADRSEPAGPSEAAGRFDPAAPLPSFDAAGLLARQWAEVDEPLELSAAEIAALPVASGEPPDVEDVPWWLTDEFFGSDEAEQEAWLRGLPADIAAGWRDEPRSDDLPGAGFTHRDAGVGPRPEAGFAAGGVLDGALPGPVLAAGVAAAAARGGALGESELIGVLCAWQRLVSWAQAGQAGCVNLLVERRKDQSVELQAPALASHVDDEVAAALALTGQAAVRLVAVAGGLGRLPCVLGALKAGRIDWAKAVLFIDLLAGLPDDDANEIAGAVVSTAGGRTSGQLRAALARAVLAYDPEAAERRRKAARKDASVQSWTEGSGNACLAGRELDPADVIEASARLTGQARWLREHGATGSTDELRAAAYVAALTGRSLDTLLPRTDGQPGSAADGPAGSAADGQPALGLGLRAGSGPAPAAGGPLGGTINLTMPLSDWLGLGDAPGEVAGYGPADAATCRDLVGRTGPGTRWCLTVTGADGRAVAHACAPAGSPGPASIRWAAGLRSRMQFLESGTCGHARRTSRYRPPANLVHLIRVRQRTCSFPGCRRPARRTDLDHTQPWQQGGSTCECNLAPLCRRHHQAKQAQGWHLTQDQPGVMTWRTPSGRRYTTLPDPYPA